LCPLLNGLSVFKQFFLPAVEFGSFSEPGEITLFPCSQKRGGRLYINNKEVNDLGIYRNITGFVPQVCAFFYECYFNCPNIVIELLLQDDCGSACELFEENVREMVVVFFCDT